jgi:hypothetical protein
MMWICSEAHDLAWSLHAKCNLQKYPTGGRAQQMVVPFNDPSEYINVGGPDNLASLDVSIACTAPHSVHPLRPGIPASRKALNQAAPPSTKIAFHLFLPANTH